MNNTHINKIGCSEKNKTLQYNNIIKNSETHSKYYLLSILKDEIINNDVENFKNDLINKYNMKNINIKFVIFQNNFFLLFIMESNTYIDLNQTNSLINEFDIINIISDEHHNILLDENHPESYMLKLAYLYGISQKYVNQ